ncbi:helix-turn-helix transcriptional regulator [Rhodocytophaga rosea]|uniref:Helix-turn-helix transcriptional regulator n=1 Tax=Rhodocytophaga rosea TaxID=2704465 RepID=A0A6C0GE18_9BACT|nr:AraC family transcriptional regulator [Rhodocytophaga rosea]QHT66216.1 helix-turn-helix transcriptional regulator [Rhodocytophaga rosea]
MPTLVRNKQDGALVHTNDYRPSDFYQESVDEKMHSIRTPAGELVLQQWHFEGIRIGYSQSVVHLPAPLFWQGDMELVQLLFNLRGVSTFEGTVLGDLSFRPMQHTLFYSKGFEGILQAEKGIHESVVIQFAKESFLNLMEETTEPFRRMGEAIAKGKAVKIAPHPLPISLPLQTILAEIISCPYMGKMKRIFLYAKTMEILMLLAEAYQNYALHQGEGNLPAADKQRIIFARDYLIEHLQYPPTIPELSKIVGINECKLKKGFRVLYQQSLFSYLTDYRMEMAKAALLEKQKNISELSYDLGYSSPQHFSTAFKKKFGIAPSQIKKR